ADEAEQQFRLARRAVDEMIQIAQEELADKPHLEGPRKRLLAAALAYYEEFIEQRRDDPGARDDLRATRADVKKLLADLAGLQGDRQLFLLKDPAVLDDLRLSAEQRQQIGELSERLDRQRPHVYRGLH